MDGKGGGEKLGGVEEGEIIIRIYYVRKTKSRANGDGGGAEAGAGCRLGGKAWRGWRCLAAIAVARRSALCADVAAVCSRP